MKFTYKNTAINFDLRVYEPSEDSFILADAALSMSKNAGTVLEVGCGCGMISAVLKKNTSAKVAGIDINPYAAACTRKNGIEAIIGDLLTCIKGEFDLIIFNPPYLPTDESERTEDWINIALDGGINGRKLINRFLKEAFYHLSENGNIILLVSSFTGIEEVKSSMRSIGYDVKEIKRDRYSFEELAAIAGTKAGRR